MRHQDPQTQPDQPEAVKSEPVPVPPPGKHGTTIPEHPRHDPDAYSDHDQDPDRHDQDPDRLDQDPDRLDTGDVAAARDQVDDTPTTDRGDLADANRVDALDGPDASDQDRTDQGRTDQNAEFHEPPAQPTAFGAGSVGGAVAASALASGTPADERDARDDDTVRPGDGRADDLVNGSGADRESVAVGAPHPVSPHVLSAGDPDAADGTPAAAADEPATTADGELLPGTVPTGPTTLFTPEEAGNFRDRWREVQLRFVDDPRAATGQAQELVEDAVSALTAALDRQRGELNGWQGGDSTDTEQLRVVVRRYRDFLDRLLDL